MWEILFLSSGNVRTIFHILHVIAFQLIMSQDCTAKETCRTMTTVNFSEMWQTHHVVADMMSEFWFGETSWTHENILWWATSFKTKSSCSLILKTHNFWFLIFLFVFYYVTNIFARLVTTHISFFSTLIPKVSTSTVGNYNWVIQNE